ncbi:1,4-dihydroxy-6-naphtoate synthase [Fundidesulfovibrio magnetotacticus]|uniref:1,4-dihydroxy-6-naphtoate synthase n=1 Tax=Fundidesulfovibrio magnetotacticus TaxID=2730080 RepID=A0A6V8LVW5_9BACT|nr:1,4-dihydroxy-6-naphtoate synthase [Fundidesulfovibrio magnetotacticus]
MRSEPGDRVVTDTPGGAVRQGGLSLGISPCPNDTFIFHALAHGVTEGPTFEPPLLADVEELNARASRGELDVVKISLAAVAEAAAHYRLLSCGGALGRGVGPLLLTHRARNPRRRFKTLAVPGRRTTAALLARLMGVEGSVVELRYDEIMPALAACEVDAGVVIHEGRFTYPGFGLRLVEDLGAWWEGRFSLPLPLGVIAVRRDLGPEVAQAVAGAIRASLRHARAHPDDSREWIAANAQELSPEVTARHIETFVTDFSMDVGEEGRRAIELLAGRAFEAAGTAPEGGLFW